MKHIKIYENFTNIIIVEDIIKKYGNEDAEFFLKTLLTGKYVKITDGYVTKYKNMDVTVSHVSINGVVERIFYISTSGFTIIRFEDETDIVINRSKIYCDDYLDINSVDMLINSKKYNL